jgi:rSAM/selenodomain-associated transferase 2
LGADAVISIVIPTLNEARRLPPVLDALGRQGTACEVIVADGGSDDATVGVARAHGARVVVGRRGRGAQLAAGASLAQGEVVLFLHADSVFPEGGLARIERILAVSPRIVGGNFRVVFDGDDRFSRWLTRAYAWIRRRGWYYGDSGVFVRTPVYRALGGVRPMALMEDYDFVRRLERFGATCCIDEPALVTSSRRFRGRRPVAIVWGWIRIHLLYALGASPDRLARLYDSETHRPGSARTS